MTRPVGQDDIISQYGIVFEIVIEMTESDILFSA